MVRTLDEICSVVGENVYLVTFASLLKERKKETKRADGSILTTLGALDLEIILSANVR